MLLLTTVAAAAPWVEIPVDFREISPGETEISGMDWLDESHLLVLPQSRDAPTQLVILDASVVSEALDGLPAREAILARPAAHYPIRSSSPLPGLRFGGFEAVYTEPAGPDAWTLWLVSEWEGDDTEGAGACVHRTRLAMEGAAWVLSGELSNEWCVRLPAAIPNSGIEAVLATASGRLAIPEFLGASQGVYGLADGTARPAGPSFPWRVTDASRLRRGKAWVTNVLWNGEAGVYASGDAAKVGCVPEKGVRSCGRLVEVSWDGTALVEHRSLPLDIPPLDRTENWEGIVRFDHRGREGVLIATDRHTSEDEPRTILAWVDVSSATPLDEPPEAAPPVRPAFRPIEARRFATKVRADDADEGQVADLTHGIVDQLIFDPVFRGLVEARDDLFVRCARWSQQRLDTTAFFTALADGPSDGIAPLAALVVDGERRPSGELHLDEDAVEDALAACGSEATQLGLVNEVFRAVTQRVQRDGEPWLGERCPAGGAVFSRRRFTRQRGQLASYQLANMAQCYLAARSDDVLDMATYRACLTYPRKETGTTMHPSRTGCVGPL